MMNPKHKGLLRVNPKHKAILHDIAHCRSGDKGDTLTLAVFAWDEDDYPLLLKATEIERVREHFKGMIYTPIRGIIHRFELPHVQGVLLVCEGAQGGGVTISTALDPHGKSLSYALLGMPLF